MQLAPRLDTMEFKRVSYFSHYMPKYYVPNENSKLTVETMSSMVLLFTQNDFILKKVKWNFDCRLRNLVVFIIASQVIVMILSHVEQISLMNSMEKVYVKVNSENGESEQGLMESTKIRKGN